MQPAFKPTYNKFSTLYRSKKTQLFWTRLVNDLDTPVSAFLKLAKDEPYAFLFESVQGGEQRGRYSVLGFAPDLIWRANGDVCESAIGAEEIKANTYRTLGDKPIESLRQLILDSSVDIPEGVPPMAAGLFGYLGYDMIRQVEHLPNQNPDPIGTPDALMTRPTIIAIFDQISQEIIITTTVRFDKKMSPNQAYEAAQSRVFNTCFNLELSAANFRNKSNTKTLITQTSLTPQTTYCASVKKAQKYIKNGDIFQVVLGHRMEAPLSASPFALYRSLRRLNPSPFLYYLNFEDHAVVGSSPEILVRLRNDTVTIRPIAGTRPRGETPERDRELANELLADEKENAEHLMLLDLGRNDVGRVAKPGTIKVTQRSIIERYSHVMHIVSNVEGEIKQDLDALDALFAGFPAGTVSGAPKVRAMEIIDELETEKRGIYAGAVGYISANGDMDTAIALRTAVIKNGKMHVRAGAGIVMDSKPKSEYEECQNKARALFAAAEQAPYFDEN
ncbi:MAG: anthranilate synthase component I [Robiginitomaculum sp.]